MNTSAGATFSFSLFFTIHFASGCLEDCVCDHSSVTCRDIGFQNFQFERLPSDATSFAFIGPTNWNLNLNYSGDFATLHAANFSNLQHLVHLTLTKTGIKDLIEEPFLHVPRLQSLNLSCNFIHQLSTGVFNGAHNHLRVLDLSHNYLTDLHNPGLFYLPHLKHLDLSYNNLNTTPWMDIFSKTHVLETLILDGNDIQVLRGSMFSYLNRLLLLSVKNCHITRVDIDFQYYLSDLVTLDLRWNEITDLSTVLFSHPSKLDFLYLDHNVIDSIPCDSLAALNLHTLSLSFNNISVIDVDAFRLLDTKELNLSHNKLDSIPNGTFASLSAVLLKLTLSSNGINADLNITELEFLQDLNLSSNAFAVIPNNIRYLPQLNSLDLSYNRLQTLTSDDLTLILKLTYVDLYSNTWNCDCELFNFYHQWQKQSERWQLCGDRNLHNSNRTTISNQSSVNTFSECIICSKPVAFTNRSLSTLAIDLQQCAVKDKDNLLGLYILCGVILFMVVILLVFIWTRRSDQIPGSSLAAALIGRDRRSSWIWEILSHKKGTVIENTAVAGCSNEADKNSPDETIQTITRTTTEHRNKNLQVFVEPSSEQLIISNPVALNDTLGVNTSTDIISCFDSDAKEENKGIFRAPYDQTHSVVAHRYETKV